MSPLLTYAVNMVIVVLLFIGWILSVWYAYRTGKKDGRELLQAEIRLDEARQQLAEEKSRPMYAISE